MASNYQNIENELKSQGINLKKLKNYLITKDQVSSMEMQGVNLLGLLSWLQQAPEMFLLFQEKPQNKFNLRELREWLEQNLEKPTSSKTEETNPLVGGNTTQNASTTTEAKEIQTREEATSSPVPIEISGMEDVEITVRSAQTEEEEEEDWEAILKELEEFDEDLDQEAPPEEIKLGEEKAEDEASQTSKESSETTETKPVKKKEPSYYLKRKDEIQGPYHYSRVLRYLQEGRLPKGVKFSLNKETWSDIALFPLPAEEIAKKLSKPSTAKGAQEASTTSETVRYSSEELKSELDKEIDSEEAKMPEEFWLQLNGDTQGPYHYTRILRYLREGRLPDNVEFSSDQEKWEEIDFFPYSLDEEKPTIDSMFSIELSQTTSQAHETGILNTDDGEYEGELLNKLPHGHGKICYPDGSEYVGGFRNGKFQGRGGFTFPDGGKYEGDWQDGNMHGLGKLIDVSGNVYNGKWENGDQTGLGTLTSQNGLSYVGEFKQGKFHGWGTYTWPTGQTYVGEFNEGDFHGEGTMTVPTLFGKKTQTGLWEYGEYIGATKEFAEATKAYKREARLGNKLAQKRLKELGIKWRQ